MVKSKKLTAAIVAVAVVIANRFGLFLPLPELTMVVGAIVAYVVAQGVADHGKEAVKEHRKNGE